MRITTQLIDAESGHHIWAERYDRKTEDVLALQDEIAQAVAGTVAGRLKMTAEDAASYAELGRTEEAQAQISLLLSGHPEASLHLERDWAYSGEPGQRYVEALRMAGLPE